MEQNANDTLLAALAENKIPEPLKEIGACVKKIVPRGSAGVEKLFGEAEKKEAEALYESKKGAFAMAA